MHKNNALIEYNLETFKKLREIKIPGNNEYVDI